MIELLRDAFGNERLGGKIAFKSDDVPLFVLEMVRGLRTNRLVRRLPDGRWVESQVIEDVEVPSAVRDLVAARLAGLGNDDRMLLDLASVQGYEFDPDLLARIRGHSRMVILERLAAIERSTWAVRGEGRLSHFDHHPMQEILYSDLHQSLRAEYHAALAGALSGERGSPRTVRRICPERSRGSSRTTILKGSRPQADLPFVGPALLHLSESYRSDQALEIADQALSIEGLLRGAPRADVLMSKADRLGLLGRGDEERAALEEALRIRDAEGRPGEQARVLNALGFHLHRVARYEEARENLERAFELALLAEDRTQEGLAIRGLGTVLWTLGNHGNVLLKLGRLEEAELCRRRHLVVAQEGGDPLARGIALTNLAGTTSALLSDWSRASGPGGVVRDATGDLVDGAHVILRHDPSTTEGSPLVFLTRTDRPGRFRLPTLPMLDDLSLLVRHQGKLHTPIPIGWREEGRWIDVGLREE